MARDRRLCAPVLLLAALAALLVFAATAAAETRTGESTSIAFSAGTTSREATLVRSSASYETSDGTAIFKVTTVAEPQEENEGEPSETVTDLALMTATSGCSLDTLKLAQYSSPLLAIESHYSEPTSAKAAVAASIETLPEFTEPVTKTVAGTTTTFAITLGQIANQGFNCAFIETREEAGQNFMVFPISVPPAPPAPPAPVPAPVSQPAPALAPASPPAALSIGKVKTLKLKVGKSRRVKVKVTNTGGTATGLGSLRVKAPKGVLVKPKRQKIPILAPGASWRLPVRVQLTAKAKKRSTISLTGTAPGLSAKTSFVVKLVG